MSSPLSDVMSTAVAMMMSAAFAHFGVTGGTPPDPKPAPAQSPSVQSPAVHVAASATGSSDASPPVPGDDERFSAHNQTPPAARSSRMHDGMS